MLSNIQTMSSDPRSRSLSPSTSIKSHLSDNSSDSDESSADDNRYAGLTEDELYEIWQRRNLAYFDRRQRKIEEEGQRSSSHSSNEVAQQHSGGVSGSSGEVPPPPAAAASAQNQTSAYGDATENPVWRDVTSRNMMGEYDPQNTDPAYHNSWMACQRLVDMHRPEALEAANNFIPSNPRLAALLENQRLENARGRYEEQQQGSSTRRRQREWSSAPFFPQHQDDQGMDVGASSTTTTFGASSTTSSSSLPPTSYIAYQQQVAEYERLHQAYMLQQRQRQRTAANSSPESDSSSRSSKYKSVDSAGQNCYMALPQTTKTLTRPCVCTGCNSALYTAALAKRIYCQTCGCITSLPRMDAEACYEEKMQDAADFDVSEDQNMSW